MESNNKLSSKIISAFYGITSIQFIANFYIYISLLLNLEILNNLLPTLSQFKALVFQNRFNLNRNTAWLNLNRDLIRSNSKGTVLNSFELIVFGGLYVTE